jgi:hypothetical protein
MAMFGESGSTLDTLKAGGILGEAGSDAYFKQWFGPMAKWYKSNRGSDSMGYGMASLLGYASPQGRWYGSEPERGFKSFYMGGAAPQGRDFYSGWHEQEGTLPAGYKKGYNIFSPLGKYMGEQNVEGNPSERDAGLEDRAQEYTGISKSGGWQADDEGVFERMNRVKGLSDWQPEKLKELSTPALGAKIGTEFRPTKSSGQISPQMWATHDAGTLGYADSEIGGQIDEQNRQKLDALGTLSDTNITDIISASNDFDPIPDPNNPDDVGGWDPFRESIEGSGITGANENIGNTLRDWFETAGTDYDAYTTALKNKEEHTLATGTAEQDWEDYVNITIPQYQNQLNQQQLSMEEADEGIELGRESLTNPMAGVRAGLLQEAEAAKQARYGSGFEGGGANIDAERRKNVLLSDSLAQQKTMKDAIEGDIAGYNLMETDYNLMSDTLGSEAEGTGMYNTASEMYTGWQNMLGDTTYQDAIDASLDTLGDSGADFRKTLGDEQARFGETSEFTLDKWLDDMLMGATDFGFGGNY